MNGIYVPLVGGGSGGKVFSFTSDWSLLTSLAGWVVVDLPVM